MSKRVVIIGAGVIGLATAYYCAQRGFKVTVVERKAAERDGTSFGNAGMVVPSHFIPLAAPGMVALGLKWMWNPASPFYIQPRLDADLIGWGLRFIRAANEHHVRRSAPLLRDLSLASRKCFEEIAALPGVEFGLVKRGLLMLCQSEAVLEEEEKTAQEARRLGIPAEVLNAKQTAALDSGARMNIVGAVHFPLDCHLSPARFMSVLQQQCEQLGVAFCWNREVTDWKIEDRGVRSLKVTTSKSDFASNAVDEIEADEFVVCGGAWSTKIAERLRLKIPMQAGKGYSLTLPEPRQLPQICSILTEARVAVTPMGKTLRVGGTMEIAGLNEDINPMRVCGIVNSFCRYFPEFQPSDFAGVEPWRGLRPCSPDGLPYLGRAEKFSNLSVATGHAMMGLSLGPVSGKLMAQILANETPSFDLTLLSPDRFS